MVANRYIHWSNKNIKKGVHSCEKIVIRPRTDQLIFLQCKQMIRDSGFVIFTFKSLTAVYFALQIICGCGRGSAGPVEPLRLSRGSTGPHWAFNRSISKHIKTHNKGRHQKRQLFADLFTNARPNIQFCEYIGGVKNLLLNA